MASCVLEDIPSFLYIWRVWVFTVFIDMNSSEAISLF